MGIFKWHSKFLSFSVASWLLAGVGTASFVLHPKLRNLGSASASVPEEGGAGVSEERAGLVKIDGPLASHILVRELSLGPGMGGSKAGETGSGETGSGETGSGEIGSGSKVEMKAGVSVLTARRKPNGTSPDTVMYLPVPPPKV